MADALELLHSCTKPLIWWSQVTLAIMAVVFFLFQDASHRCYYCQMKFSSKNSAITHCFEKHPHKPAAILRPFSDKKKLLTKYQAIHFKMVPYEFPYKINKVTLDDSYKINIQLDPLNETVCGFPSKLSPLSSKGKVCTHGVCIIMFCPVSC